MLARQIFEAARSELEGWKRLEFVEGLRVPASGLLALLLPHRFGFARPQEVVSSVSSKLFFVATVFSFVSMTILAILWLAVALVLRVIVMLSRLLHHQEVSHFFENALPFSCVFHTMAFLVPQFVILFIRYWAYTDQDRVFVSSLRQCTLPRTPQEHARLQGMADALETLPTESVGKWFKRYSLNLTKNALVAIVLYLLSSVRYIGPLLLPGAIALQRNMRVGIVPSTILLCISFVPAGPFALNGRTLALCGSQLLILAKTVPNELLYTVLGRCTSKQRKALSRRHQARVLGFGSISALALSVPMVGPLLWFNLTQCAAEVFAAIVVADVDGIFDLRSALEEFKAERSRRKEEEELLAIERVAKAERRKNAQESKARVRGQ